MKKLEYENLAKQDLNALVAQRKTLEIEKIKEIAENFAKSEKAGKKIKQIKKKIAWVETLISQKLYNEN